MNHASRRTLASLITLFLLVMAAVPACIAAPVLMISIDGLKPEYVTDADARGLKVSYLRSLMRDGAYAEGVTGVWPTVTYPSHTTLLTGVSPAEHGIYNNLEFDPGHDFGGAWYWYASAIRVPTLWQAAHRAGLRTASVGWPVSVGATDVDWLIPEFWRAPDSSDVPNPADRDLMAALTRPDTLLQQLQPALGPYMMGNETTISGDEIKTRYSVEILRGEKPDFMTVHLSSLDETEHEHAPFSAEANQVLEAIDGMVARLAAAALANDPSTVIVVVSDHGFVTITHAVNLYVPFIEAGLMRATVNPKTGARTIVSGKVESWKAEPWMAGGMVAILLHDPNDHQTERQAGELLHKLAADENSGIAAVLDREQIKKTGGFPEAAFLIILKSGYHAESATSGALVTPIAGSKGSHGFSPEFPEMRASFFIAGAGIAPHRDLGLIDMRQIAPTVARILHLSMPSAKAAPLPVQLRP